MRSFILLIFVLSIGATLASHDSEFAQGMEEYSANQDKFCWKKSRPRGAGHLPDNCEPGFEDVLGRCFKVCEPGFHNDGLTCRRKKPLKIYSRERGDKGACDANEERSSIGRCYPRCPQGMYGEGPVCWRRCSGNTPIDCGAACASSKGQCAGAVLQIIKSVFDMIGDLAELVMTGGASAAGKAIEFATDPTAALNLAFELAQKFVQRKVSKENFISFMSKKAQRIGSKVDKATLSKMYEKASSGVDSAKFSMEVASSLDPTGISNVINAFLQDVC